MLFKHFFLKHEVFIEFVTIFLLFYVLVFWPQGMRDLSFLTRDHTRAPFIGRQCVFIICLLLADLLRCGYMRAFPSSGSRALEHVGFSSPGARA